MKFISKTGVKYDLDIDVDDSICEVKVKLSNKINSSYDNIRLIFQCKILEDNMLFREYNIPQNEFVPFYLIKERIIKNRKGEPNVCEICLCGNFQSKVCKLRPISVNISNFSRGIIYNIRTTAGTKIIDAIKDSPFKDIWGPSNRLVYNKDYIDENQSFMHYNLQDKDIIKQVDFPIEDETLRSHIFDDDDDDNSIWELLGLNRKETCTIIWINFLNNNYEYFTAREKLEHVSVSCLIDRISKVFDIPVERIEIFSDRHQKHPIKDQIDIDNVYSGKHKKKFFLRGNSDPSPKPNHHRLSGYQYSMNIYYSFVPDLDRLILRELIGHGAYGVIYQCIDVDSNKTFALKKFKIPYDETFEAPNLDMEIDILCALGSHPRIVKFERRILADNALYVLMEYTPGGSLRNFLNKNGALPECQIALYSGQILEALEYLHGQKIIHRDIKSDNILLDENHNVKLADFGLSKHLIGRATESFLNKATNSFVGTVNYMAPEIITGKNYGSQADIWSVGATIIEMLTGKPPYYHLGQLNVLFKIGNESKIEFNYPENTSKALLDFIDLCLKSNPSHRPTADKLLDHLFLSEN